MSLSFALSACSSRGFEFDSRAESRELREVYGLGVLLKDSFVV